MQIDYYPWQDQQWQYLLGCAKQNRIPHAVLLQGMSGLGKLAFAQAYALMLLCRRGLELSHACGDCSDCHWGLAGHHPDLCVVQPEGKQIRIEQIRQVINNTIQTAINYRVIIIEPIECFHPAAANALLKVLEEPLGKTLFILINHQSLALLPTIKSRCQKLNFIPNKASLAWLQSRVAEKAKLLLALAEDSPLRALAIQAEMTEILQLLEDLLALQLKQKTALELAVQWLNKDLDKLLAVLTMWVNYLIKFKSKLILAKELPESTMQQICHRISLAGLFTYLDCLYQAKSYIQQSINPQLFLEDIFYSWVNVNKGII